MKTKPLFRFLLASAVALSGHTLSGCSGDDASTPPGNNNEVTGQLSVTFDTDGLQGDGSIASPILVEKGGELNMVIKQKSSYADPNGGVITCEPKASINVKAKLDTLYTKNLKTLTTVNSPKVTTTSSGSYPVSNNTTQTFDIGGQEITFNLAYEIYRIVNSENNTVEMPYLKLSPANYGTAIPQESKDGNTRAMAYVTGITLTPLNQTRGVTVTDSEEYNVSVSFNLDTECVHAKERNKRNLSFTVDYVAIVETSTEYPDPETTFTYNLNVIGGTTNKTSPFTLSKKQTMHLEWKQAVKHTFFSQTDMTMKELDFEQTAYTKLSAAADTIWAASAADLEKVTATEPVVNVKAGEIEQTTSKQTFDIGGQKISAEWVYEICRSKMPNGEDNAFPYLELGKMNLVSVKAVKKGGAEDVEEVDGKTVGVYEITAKFSQDLMTQQQNEEAKQTVEYIVKYIGVIEVKLVDIKYRKDYVWHQPHDNIPLALQLIVYRDRVYSNGVTFTDEYRSNLMAVDWSVFAASRAQDGGGKIDEEIILPNGEKVFYHKLSINNTDYGGGGYVQNPSFGHLCIYARIHRAFVRSRW